MVLGIGALELEKQVQNMIVELREDFGGSFVGMMLISIAKRAI